MTFSDAIVVRWHQDKTIEKRHKVSTK